MIDAAMATAARGWFVFPCKPRTKQPATQNGFKDATLDRATIREWWTRWPDANVAIATGPSGLCVLDIDHGIDDLEHLAELMKAMGLPDTYAVRTGRRPEFGVQLYYLGSDLKSVPWMDGELSGDTRCATGYVMAAGSVHPSGERYERLGSFEPDFVPEYVRNLKAFSLPVVQNGRMDKIPAGGGRHHALSRVAGSFPALGFDADAIYEQLVAANVSMMEDPVPDKDLREMADGIARRYPAGGPEPEVILGRADAEPGAALPPVDWRTRYMSEEAYLNVQPPAFLIDGFLVEKTVAMLAGPVSQRKSIIALNLAHALCTGEALFGYFEVLVKPERIIYLCPEMGAASFVKRIKQLGLGGYIGKSLFIQTMSEQLTALDDLDGELPGAVVIVDTITRFIEGDANKSEDMRQLLRRCFD